MLLEPSWVCVTYRTDTNELRDKLLYPIDPDDKKIINKVYCMENRTLCDIAREIIPDDALFDPGIKDSIRFAFRIPKFSQCRPEPYIVVWFDGEGLNISGNELGNIPGWWKAKEMATSTRTMRDMKESLGIYLDWLTHLEEYRDFCRENKDRIL